MLELAIILSDCLAKGSGLASCRPRVLQAKPERPLLNLCSFSYQPNINSALHFMVVQVSNQSAVPHRFINWSYPINSVVIRAKRWPSKSQLKQTRIVTSPPGNMQLQYPASLGGHNCLFLPENHRHFMSCSHVEESLLPCIMASRLVLEQTVSHIRINFFFSEGFALLRSIVQLLLGVALVSILHPLLRFADRSSSQRRSRCSTFLGLTPRERPLVNGRVERISMRTVFVRHRLFEVQDL
jgi:hypothetical protein